MSYDILLWVFRIFNLEDFDIHNTTIYNFNFMTEYDYVLVCVSQICNLTHILAIQRLEFVFLDSVQTGSLFLSIPDIFS